MTRTEFAAAYMETYRSFFLESLHAVATGSADAAQIVYLVGAPVLPVLAAFAVYRAIRLALES